MTQNRNKLIDLFMGNIVNSIVHQVLEKAVNDEMAVRYRKELTTSFDIAKKYRNKINPLNRPFFDREVLYIKEQIIKRVRGELLLRISKGYENINLDLIEELVDDSLKKLNII